MIERTVTPFDRDTVRSIITEINGYNPYTRYKVLSGNRLAVTVPGGLLPEQRELIKAHKDDLIAYLVTPPDIIGICRHGHRVQWQCTEHGAWVCACYHGTLPIKEVPQREEKP